MAKRALNILLSGICCWDFVNYRPGLLKVLLQAGHAVTVLAPADGYEDKLRARGVQVVCMPFNRGSLNPVHDLGLLIRYFFKIKKIAPDVIISFGIKPVIYGGIAAALLRLRSAAVITGLGSAFMRGKFLQRAAGRLYRLGLHSAEKVFFLNAEDLAYFRKERIVAPEKASLLPGEGIDMQHFVFQAWPEGGLSFLFVGRLLGDKGVREFVDAARVVRKSMPAIRFGLLGKIDEFNPSGIPLEEIDAWVREGSVAYLGSQEDVRPFIAACHVVVLPSYREGLPRALLEAAASGRPVLASDVEGCRDVVLRGETGWLCEAHSSEALVKSILAIASMPTEQLKAMGVRGREYVAHHYSDAVVCEAYLGFLNGVSELSSH